MKQFTRIISLLFIALIMSNCKKENNPGPAPVGTSLKITVKNTSGSVVAGAQVQLYTSFIDWEAKTGIMASQTTGADGMVTFNNLSSIKYYFFASKDCFNNGFTSVSTSGPITTNSTTNTSTVIDQSGALILKNNSSHPYRIYINTVANFDLPGNTIKRLEYKPAGNYTIRVLQLSGYAVSPTDQTYAGVLN